MLTCPPAEKSVENIRVKILEGSIYSVDEVSDLLGIPRPTLYRYLREYSIPHLRRGGRIQIPEDSFDRIREVRDLHKEGLGTDSVRRQLREGAGPDTEELDRRLDSLHDTLEDLRGELRERPATGEVALSPALRTVLARQSLMLSAMFNLTGMVEDLLFASGRPRKRPLEDVHGGSDYTVLLPAGGRAGITGTVLVEPAPVREAEAATVISPASLPPPDAPTRFGSLGRRRRRGALALVSVLLLGLLLALFLPTLVQEGSTSATGAAPKETAAGGAAGQAGDNQTGGPAPQEATTDEAKDTAQPTDAALPAEERAPDETNTRATTAEDQPGGIPDVSGRPLEAAARAVSEAGFSVAAIKAQTSPEKQGTVLETEPSAGTEARPDAPVVLTMSAGPAGVLSASAASSASPESASASASPASVTSASASASASPTP
jgi:excisionase family DNA binding protein